MSFPLDITELLICWNTGDRAAREASMPLVEKELHRLAHHYLKREHRGHTAGVLGVSSIAVLREWKMAKAWLSREIKYGI